MRARAGCPIVQSDSSLQWPHDALLVPSAALEGATPPNRSALAHEGAHFALFVAELAGRSLKRYNSAGASPLVERATPYGR